MRHAQHMTARATRSAHSCPQVRLALHDGAEQAYRLDDPGTCPKSGATNTALSAYDPRVHLAYLLARQGHHPYWLAQFADLPLPAAHRIAEAARSAGAVEADGTAEAAADRP
ncbi:hypothetical protein [Kitasatospora sp. MAP5-34]|uniref:hypothetical protein n=1 Tax=Kitasatospora sp. MAP5-34 TaxID=3035102 RepID=UPI0024753C1F|nr:hypothetical protein [Kitasatospora sp. MAP5-34]MDH6580366.1 hypothetical protein [Kitasatospora sp. MAP5-34]